MHILNFRNLLLITCDFIRQPIINIFNAIISRIVNKITVPINEYNRADKTNLLKLFIYVLYIIKIS